MSTDKESPMWQKERRGAHACPHVVYTFRPEPSKRIEFQGEPSGNLHLNYISEDVSDDPGIADISLEASTGELWVSGNPSDTNRLYQIVSEAVGAEGLTPLSRGGIELLLRSYEEEGMQSSTP